MFLSLFLSLCSTFCTPKTVVYCMIIRCLLPPLPRLPSMLDLVHSQTVYCFVVYWLSVASLPKLHRMPDLVLTLCACVLIQKWSGYVLYVLYLYIMYIISGSFACSQSCFWACFWACARPCALPKRFIACWLVVYCLVIGCSLPLACSCSHAPALMLPLSCSRSHAPASFDILPQSCVWACFEPSH